MRPELSIVIPSYNRTDLLRACLTSVVLHAPAGTEILVVDDGSPGGAVREAARGFPGVRIMQLRRRSGFCAAANAGIRAARGPIVELLNDDTEVSPRWAEAALTAFDDPTVGAVAPLVLGWPGTGYTLRVDSAGDQYYVGGVAGKRGHGDTVGPAHLQPGWVFGASGSSAFYRREAILQLGAFPESFQAYFEDVDLSFRLHWAGYRVWFEPRSRVFHHGSSSHAPRRRLLEQQSRNEELVFWRNLPAAVLWRALPRHLAVLAGKTWLRLQEGTLPAFLAGRLRVLRQIPDLVRHRRWLQHVVSRTGHAEPNLDSWRLDWQYWGFTV